MIRFLLKGILRDKSRSILPIMVVSIGVALTVLLSTYLKGAFGDLIDQNAKFATGHVKIMTQAYEKNKDQLPNDLALLEINGLLDRLRQDFPDLLWGERIRFGGLIDIPDEKGESKGQGPVTGLGIHLLNPVFGEIKRLNIKSALVSGGLPKQNGEALISDDFAQKLNVNIGDPITYFGTDMNGSLTFQNFTVSGTMKFGIKMMDRGAVVIDVIDAQKMLDMQDGAGEILGYFKNKVYDDNEASKVANTFNAKYQKQSDEFSPIMLPLREQNNLGELLDYSNQMSAIFIFIFIFAMSIVLWNTGLLGGLRRYREFGIRLALGESKGFIYWTLILEAILIGTIGSIIGTMIGLAGSLYLQIVGIDISDMIEESSMMIPSVLRAEVSPSSFFIGFIPGLFAMVLGTMLSGYAIFKRETARLFKELEV